MQSVALTLSIAALTLSHVVALPARNLLLHCSNLLHCSIAALTRCKSRCTSTLQSVAALQHSLSVTLQHSLQSRARCNLLLHCSTHSQSRCTSTLQSVVALQHSLCSHCTSTLQSVASCSTQSRVPARYQHVAISLSVKLYQHVAICCCIAALTLSHVVPARCNLLLHCSNQSRCTSTCKHCSTHSQSRCTSTMQSVVALQHSLSVSHVVPARCNLLLHCSTHSQSRCTSTMQSVAALTSIAALTLSTTLYQHDAICCIALQHSLSHVVPQSVAALQSQHDAICCVQHSLSVTLYQHVAICCCIAALTLSHVVPRCNVLALQHSLSVTLYQHDAICCCIAALTLSVTLYQHEAICLHCSTHSQSRCTSTLQSVAALQHSLCSHVVPARCNLLLHCSTHSQSRCTSTMQSVVALQHSLSVTLYQHDAICCSIAALTLSQVARCNLLLHCSTHSQSRCTSTMQSVVALQHSLSATLYQHLL